MIDNLSPAFELASAGYLAASADELPALAIRLRVAADGRRISLRERAIIAAVDWGCANPREWSIRQRPLKFRTRPVIAIREMQ